MGQIFPGSCLLLDTGQTMQKCDHLKSWMERWNLEVSDNMSRKKNICLDGFLNNKEKMLGEKEKKCSSVSGLGVFSTHADD